MEGKLTIEIDVKEQDFLESFLNYAHQGQKEYATLLLGLYALQNDWHYIEIMYYANEGGLNG